MVSHLGTCFTLYCLISGIAFLFVHAYSQRVQKHLSENPTEEIASPTFAARNMNGRMPRNGLMHIQTVWRKCNLKKHETDDGPTLIPPGSKKVCCDLLVSLGCILRESIHSGMVIMKRLNTSQCNYYLIDTMTCDMHFGDYELIQLQSLACHNDVILRFSGTNVQDCCRQHFQLQCFKRNFEKDCKLTFESEAVEKCDKVAAIESHCTGALSKCPSYRVPSLQGAFFTSKYFIFAIVFLAVIFTFVFIFCRQCNKRDTSFEIKRDGSGKLILNKRERNSRSGSKFRKTPSKTISTTSPRLKSRIDKK